MHTGGVCEGHVAQLQHAAQGGEAVAARVGDGGDAIEELEDAVAGADLIGGETRERR